MRKRLIPSPISIPSPSPSPCTFAMLGEEKSTRTFLRGMGGGLTPCVTMRRVECTKRSLLMVMLIKPLGATEH